MNTRAKDTYSGRKLLEKFTLESQGVWDIYGEDPNCDMGGPHHTPFLERVSGKLDDVFAYAETLPLFWQWGGGGEIKHYVEKGIKAIPLGWGTEANKKEREKEAAKIEKQIKDLQDRLKTI